MTKREKMAKAMRREARKAAKKYSEVAESIMANKDRMFEDKVFVQYGMDCGLDGTTKLAGSVNVILSDQIDSFINIISMGDEDSIYAHLIKDTVETGKDNHVITPTNHLVEGTPTWSSMFACEFKMMTIDELISMLINFGSDVKQVAVATTR